MNDTEQTFRVVPVLDLQAGHVVHAVGGHRQRYRPLVSMLTTSVEPLAIACAIRETLGLGDLYVADLDAIERRRFHFDLYQRLQSEGVRLWLDAGVRTFDDAARLLDTDTSTIIVGLETLDQPATLNKILSIDKDRIVFSLDLRNGMPLGNLEHWPRDAWQVACRAFDADVHRILLLDLARVGVGEGTGTEELCQRIVTAYPNIDVIVGGGMRGAEDLRRAQAMGASAALVGSAIHDGRLTREDVVL